MKKISDLETLRKHYAELVGLVSNNPDDSFEALKQFDRCLNDKLVKMASDALNEAADDYEERADHETPADIDPDWLRSRADLMIEKSTFDVSEYGFHDEAHAPQRDF